jgi:hypothetical protein
MAQYGLPSSNIVKLLLKYRLFFSIFYKTSYFNEEVNHTEPSPSGSVPWFYSSIVAKEEGKKWPMYYM